MLKDRFPGVPLAPDVVALPQLPRGTECVAAGFPCIDVSKAGLRKGVHGSVRPCTPHSPPLTKAAQNDSSQH